ncbi:MAG TPA: MFS transporter [Jiangellaceae bacterium]|nr:MFS transporter [Jiangellaceae bacterium]
MPRTRWPLVLAIVLVGLNLRGPITSLSTVLADIQADLNLSSTTAGLLTSLPVLCFALAAPLVAVVTRRLGVNRAVLVSVLCLAVALGARPWFDGWTLLIGTAIVGITITVGNVLIPVVVRRDFAHRPGPVLSLSTSALTGGAALAAAVTAPLALVFGWRGASASLAMLAVFAAGVWVRATKPLQQSAMPARSASLTVVMRHPHAWSLAIFFGMQSALYYSVTAWLPSLLVDVADASQTAAGTAASAFQLIGIPGTLIMPVIAGRMRSWRILCTVVAVTWATFLAGLLLLPSAYVLWCVLGGITQGGGIAIGLSLVTMRAADVGSVPALSALVQTVAYTIGAIGPVVVGAMFTTTVSWSGPLLILLGAAVLMLVSGLLAGSSRPISGSVSHAAAG